MTRSELARTAGVEETLLEGLVESGILVPDEQGHPPGDVYRARYVALALESGIALEDLATSLASGVVRLGDVDIVFPHPVGPPERSLSELATDLEVEPDLLSRIRLACGMPGRGPDDPIRPDEAQILRLIIQLARGFGDEEAGIRIARNYGERVQRIVVSGVRTYEDLVATPQLSAMPNIDTETRRRMSERGRKLIDLAEELITATHRRHMEAALMAMWVRNTESQMARHGTVEIDPSHAPAIAFADLSGFTELTDVEGDETGVWLAGQLVAEAEKAAAAHGAHIVKLLGDGVMLHSDHAGRLIDMSLALVEALPRAGLPPAHVGIHAGPLIERDGDYFGRTVNVASRITSQAAAGEILVSEAAASLAATGVRMTEVPAATLRGVSEPIRLFRISR